MEEIQKEILYSETLNKVEGEFVMPAWLDCTWKRVPCGKEACPLCARVERRQGEEMEEVKLHINSAMVMVREEIDRPGERPKLSAFPQGLETVNWCRQIVKIGRFALEEREPWLLSVAAADLFWYVDVLAIKVARQLVNRWELEQGDKETLPDYQYTRRVIGECCTILISSLEELALLDSKEKAELMLALMELRRLKQVLVNI
jgi:hypothetical protein